MPPRNYEEPHTLWYIFQLCVWFFDYFGVNTFLPFLLFVILFSFLPLKFFLLLNGSSVFVFAYLCIILTFHW